MLVKKIITPEGVCCRVDDDAYRGAAPEEIARRREAFERTVMRLMAAEEGASSGEKGTAALVDTAHKACYTAIPRGKDGKTAHSDTHSETEEP